MTNKIKNDDIEKMITEIRKMRKDIQLVVLNLPEIDSQNPTQLEQYILQHHSNSDQMLESLRKTSSIPYEFSSYDYPPEDLVEILTTPEQLLIDNKLVLTDKYGKCVNIRQGCRVTTYQPDTFLNTIYFTDGCRI
ncbi:hypothetical protein TRFO_14781 [Tritrichomonas foetus]|uniref:Uncharacterized protein n=1 Tax=Tritrichomonas foetus TaxID=1144522 RepID=A0A1J4KVB0_9EUKA|nr:hypothetical protein TRFO_14781 [Tritrichomonas foetus]|eukprot:OHT14832.1 hypothetical protein TRFO_14781 [Tritrichomonas foetus]